MSYIGSPNDLERRGRKRNLAKGTFKQTPGLLDGRWLVVSPEARRVAQIVPNHNAADLHRLPGHLIELTDLETGKLQHKIETGLAIRHLTFSPDGKWLAAASHSSAVLRIYDVATGKEKHHIRTRSASISRVAFAPDSAQLYLGEHQGNVNQYSVATGERTAGYTAPVHEPIRAFGFAPDGKVLALAVRQDALFYWEVATGKILSLVGVPTSGICNVSFAPNGELFVAEEGGHKSWWNPRTGIKLRDLKVELPYPDILDERGMPFREFFDVNMAPSAEFLAVGVSDVGIVSIYNAKSGKLLYDDEVNVYKAKLCFFEGGKKTFAVKGKKVRIWNTRTGRDISSFDLPLRETENVFELTGASTGQYLALVTTGDKNGGRTLLWDVEAKKIIREWPVLEDRETLEFSGDGRWLAVALRREKIRLIRVGVRGEYPIALSSAGVDLTQFAFSPDHRQLAVAGAMPTPNNLSVPNFQGDGKIWIVELASKKVRQELVGHPTGAITQLAFSPDSALLASGGTDTTAFVWQAGLRAFQGKRAAKMATTDELTDWFKRMAGEDAKIAFQSMIKLVNTPEQAVKLLEEKIPPIAKVDLQGRSITQWIDDVGSSQFAVRSKASTVLEKVGASAEPDVRAALPKAKDVETTRRLETLLEQFAPREWTREELLHSRAVEILEAIATSEARTLLARWADGNPGTVLTREAGQAMARLAKAEKSSTDK